MKPKSIIEHFPAAYFALVMATGIVSIAAHLLEMEVVSRILFGINQAAFVLLWLLMLMRTCLYFPQMTRDLADPLRGPGFFAVIAGTCVLGVQYVLLASNFRAAIFLWGLGITLWMIVMCVFFAGTMMRDSKPAFEKSLNGAWLVSVVSTESIAILGALIAPQFSLFREPILFFALSMHFLGGMLYLLLITLIFYRMLFFPLNAESLQATYWINMGAAAITALAGSTLILNTGQWTFLSEITPFLKGLTLFFWATATGWIPFLLILGIWRHFYKKFPLGYNLQYWGLVFPLGMYTVCTFQLARAMNLKFLFAVPGYFVYAAMAAWLFTFIGTLRRMASYVG